MDGRKIVKPVKLIIQMTAEVVEFSDFIDQVIKHKDRENEGVNKPPSENEVIFKANS